MVNIVTANTRSTGAIQGDLFLSRDGAFSKIRCLHTGQNVLYMGHRAMKPAQ